MKQNETNLSEKIRNIFYCESCDYSTSDKKDFNKHSSTRKHKNKINETNETKKIRKNPQMIDTAQKQIYKCFCGLSFNSRTSLWRHTKKCSQNNNNNFIPSIDTDEDKEHLIEYLMKENYEFKQLMIEQNKQIIHLANNAGHHNNNNNTNFNLNFYLNETCKNAMNITDFVNQLQIGNYDLEETGRLGFANGISRIFINALKQINVTDRPIHCSDFKRETLYIKDNNEWNKDSENKTILTNAIKDVANKNISQIFKWTKENPEYNNSKAKVNDKYLQIVSESMSGSSQEETNKNYNKIIKNIAKQTVIEKTLD
mgnify:CR=1 FL=1